MLDEEHSQVQSIVDNLQQFSETLTEMHRNLDENNPIEERGYRLGMAMRAMLDANNSIMQANSILSGIEWPTVDRPR